MQNVAPVAATTTEHVVSVPVQAKATEAKRKRATDDGSKPIDVVKAARKRLVYTAKEIKRMKRELSKLETEHGQLQRLLNAADGKLGIASVSQLKTNVRG